MTRRRFEQLLNKNGYEFVRSKGSHFIYKKGGDIVVIPLRLNRMIGRRLIKEHRLSMA